MTEIKFGVPLYDTEGAAEREARCWETWRSLDEDTRRRLMATVRDELLRLAESVESWLPAAAELAAGLQGKRYQILFSIWPHELGEIPSLSTVERADAVLAMAGLEGLMKSLEREDA